MRLRSRVARLAQQQSTRLYVASIKDLPQRTSSIADLLRTFSRRCLKYSSASTYDTQGSLTFQNRQFGPHWLLHRPFRLLLGPIAASWPWNIELLADS